jgi:hypothetical protein
MRVFALTLLMLAGLLGTNDVARAQSVQRPATRLHEELCRPDVQVRVSDVHEILRKEIVKCPPLLD